MKRLFLTNRSIHQRVQAAREQSIVRYYLHSTRY
jgi:hypothetical protein